MDGEKALEAQDVVLAEHGADARDERLGVVERRHVQMKALEVVVLVVLAVVVMRGAGGEIALGRRPEADQHVRRQRCGGAHQGDARAQLEAHPLLDRRPVALGQKIGLVQHHQIGGAELLLEQLLERAVVIERGIGRALRRDRRRRAREHAVAHRRGVDHRDHAVHRHPGADLRPLERLEQRLRQGEPGGLDHDVLGRRHAREQPRHGRHEIVRDRAADAAVRELDDVVLGARAHRRSRAAARDRSRPRRTR